MRVLNAIASINTVLLSKPLIGKSHTGMVHPKVLVIYETALSASRAS